MLRRVLEQKQSSSRNKTQSNSTEDLEIVWKLASNITTVVKVKTSLLKGKIVKVHAVRCDEGKDKRANTAGRDDDDADSV